MPDAPASPMTPEREVVITKMCEDALSWSIAPSPPKDTTFGLALQDALLEIYRLRAELSAAQLEIAQLKEREREILARAEIAEKNAADFLTTSAAQSVQISEMESR